MDQLFTKAQLLHWSGDYGDFFALYESLLKLSPDNWRYHFGRARALLLLGEKEKAIADFRSGLRANADSHWEGKGGLAHALALNGPTDEARRIVAELLEHAEEPRISDHLAMAYAGLGATEQAIHWLEVGYHRRDPWMIWINVEPRFASLHSQRRFRELLKKMRLE